MAARPVLVVMNRSLILTLTTLALLGGAADAGRRSGGGFGGSRGSTYSAPRTPTYRAPAPRVNTAPRPRTTTPVTPNTTKANTRTATPPAGATSPLNRAAAAKVTPTQLSQWSKVKLPAGVPRDAITYSAVRDSRYAYQLQPGRYYPYPQSYYRQRGIGSDLLKYALIFTAVSSVANAVTPDVVVTPAGTTVPVAPAPGPNLWAYAGVGFLAAAAAWFLAGRRRR